MSSVENVYDLARILRGRYDDGSKDSLLIFPMSIASKCCLEDIPLVAIVRKTAWIHPGDIKDSYWEFLVYGQEKNWADLTDGQRMTIRTAGAWDGHVGDYWVELGYEDSRYYTLEALCD